MAVERKRKKRFARILRLFLINGKMDFIWLMRDTRYALACILCDTLTSVSSLGSIFVLAWQFDGVGGMNKLEVLFMLGYLMVLEGLLGTFAMGNNLHVSRIIGRGQLDHFMIQPVPLWEQMLTIGFIPFTGGGVQLFIGIGAMGTALYLLEISLPLWWFLGFLLNMGVSIIILFCIAYFTSVLAFYQPAAGEEISSYAVDVVMGLAKFPLAGMPLILQAGLLTAVPSGLIAWYPSRILLGRSGADYAFAISLAICGILFLITKKIFKKGYRYYVQTGANRYSSGGFRG